VGLPETDQNLNLNLPAVVSDDINLTACYRCELVLPSARCHLPSYS
jgi:hypothetical protein